MYFRSMTPSADGQPIVASSKRSLGVLAEESNAPDGSFGPGTGGLSVSPDSPWNLPNHRRPRGMGRGSTGVATDWVFGIDGLSLTLAELVARPDPNNPMGHAFVEPTKILSHEGYNGMLLKTRTYWRCKWPVV